MKIKFYTCATIKKINFLVTRSLKKSVYVRLYVCVYSTFKKNRHHVMFFSSIRFASFAFLFHMKRMILLKYLNLTIQIKGESD